MEWISEDNISSIRDMWNGGQKKLGWYAELMERNGKRVKAWLPGLVDKELSKLEDKNSDKKIYIRPLGMVISKNGRKYHDFDVAVVG